MRIFNSKDGDPMLLDSVEGLGKFQQEFSDFLMSSEQEVSFVADTLGSLNLTMNY